MSYNVMPNKHGPYRLLIHCENCRLHKYNISASTEVDKNVHLIKTSKLDTAQLQYRDNLSNHIACVMRA